MILLFFIFLCMIMLSLSIVFTPLLRHGVNLLQPAFALLISFFCIFTFSMYYFFGNPSGLYQWMIQGKAHYQLLTQVEQLGGIEGLIERIQSRLDQAPDDARGWFILGKLYFSQQKFHQAAEAFKKSLALNPSDNDALKYYEQSKNSASNS